MQREYREVQMFRIGKSEDPPETTDTTSLGDLNALWDVIDEYYKLNQLDQTKGKMRVQVIQEQDCAPYVGPVDDTGNPTFYTPKISTDDSDSLTFSNGDVVSGVNLIPRQIDNYVVEKNASGEFVIPLAITPGGVIKQNFDVDTDDADFGHLLSTDAYDGSGNPLLDVSGSDSFIDASGNVPTRTTNFTIIFWRNSDDFYTLGTSDPNFFNDAVSPPDDTSGGFDSATAEIGRIEIEIRVQNTGTGTLFTEITSTAVLKAEEKVVILSTIDGNGRDYWKQVAWNCGNPLLNEAGGALTDVLGEIKRSELVDDNTFVKFNFNISSENVCSKQIALQSGGSAISFDSLYSYDGTTTFWGTDEGTIEIKEIRVTINPGGRINWMPADCTFVYSEVDTDTVGQTWASTSNDTDTGKIWTAGGENASEDNEERNGSEWKFALSILGQDIALSQQMKIDLFNQPNGDLVIPIAIEFDVYDFALVDLDGQDDVIDDRRGAEPGDRRSVTTRNLPQISSFATTTFTTVRLVEDPEPEPEPEPVPEPVNHFTFRNGFLLGVLAVLLLRLLVYVIRRRNVVKLN